MITPAVAPTEVRSAVAADSTPDLSFRDFLHALTPLQYLPVVGTIYRAITGDTVNEAVRDAGSMLVGGLLGGPIGAAISAVGALVQHCGHIDLDAMTHSALVSAGVLDDAPHAMAEAAPAVIEASPCGSATAAEARAQGISAMTDAPAVASSFAIAAYGRASAVYAPGPGHA